jgi:hypothetical protein
MVIPFGIETTFLGYLNPRFHTLTSLLPGNEENTNTSNSCVRSSRSYLGKSKWARRGYTIDEFKHRMQGALHGVQEFLQYMPNTKNLLVQVSLQSRGSSHEAA